MSQEEQKEEAAGKDLACRIKKIDCSPIYLKEDDPKLKYIGDTVKSMNESLGETRRDVIALGNRVEYRCHAVEEQVEDSRKAIFLRIREAEDRLRSLLSTVFGITAGILVLLMFMAILGRWQ